MRLVGEKSYQLDNLADDLEEEEEADLDNAIADARRPNGKLIVELELNTEQARRCIATAMKHDARGTQRTRRAGDPRGNEGEKFKPFDAALLPRMAINGDALPGHIFGSSLQELQEQVFWLRTQLAYVNDRAPAKQEARYALEPEGDPAQDRRADRGGEGGGPRQVHRLLGALHLLRAHGDQAG